MLHSIYIILCDYFSLSSLLFLTSQFADDSACYIEENTLWVVPVPPVSLAHSYEALDLTNNKKLLLAKLDVLEVCFFILGILYMMVFNLVQSFNVTALLQSMILLRCLGYQQETHVTGFLIFIDFIKIEKHPYFNFFNYLSF